MTSIAARILPAPRILWNRAEPSISVGQRDGEYAGLVERRGARFIATDALGVVIGTFDDERSARSSVEPDALERRITAASHRQQLLAAVAGIAALGSTGLALAGMLHLLG